MRSSLILAIVLLAQLYSFAGDGYKIQLKVKGVKDSAMVLLANHYGDKQYIRDTVYFKNETTYFEGNEPLEGGVYMVVFPPENNYFEFIVSEQEFSLETDLADLNGSMKIKGSKENDVFYGYLWFFTKKRKEQEILKVIYDRVKAAENADSLAIMRGKLEAIDKEVKTYIDDMLINKDNMLYPKVFNAMRDPVIPEAPKDEYGTKIDSLFEYHWLKKHFFDNLDFSDQRLLRTPVFHSRLKKYEEKMIVPLPDSINAMCDFILEKASANDEVFKYCLITYLNKFANSKIMGMDAIYVHLVEKYYMTGRAPWTDSTQLYKIIKQAETMKPILIGKTCPNVAMTDTAGKLKSIHGTPADYTILFFWDPDCGHCKKATPVLKALYDSIATEINMEVFAICTETEVDKWKKYIKKNDLNWINVADPTFKTDFRNSFDINATPKIFVLDKDKKIIAKGIGVEQLGEFLKNYRERGDTLKGDFTDPLLIKEHHEGDGHGH